MKRKFIAFLLSGMMILGTASQAMAGPDGAVPAGSDAMAVESLDESAPVFQDEVICPAGLDYSDAEPILVDMVDDMDRFVDSAEADDMAADPDGAEGSDLADVPDATKLDELTQPEVSEDALDEAAFSQVLSSYGDQVAFMQSMNEEIRSNLLAGNTEFAVPILDNGILAGYDSCLLLRNLIYYCPYINGDTVVAHNYIINRSGERYFYDFAVNSYMSAAETIQWVNTVDSKIADLMEMLDATTGPGSDVFDDALALHDYMASHYQYDTSYSIYYPSVMLTKGTGVCQAYSLLFQYIMNLRGYTCYTASSSAMNHAWNLIQVDGTFYNLDVTHDDPLNDRFGMARHTYFLFPDSDESHYGRNLTDISCTADFQFPGISSKAVIDSPIQIQPEGYYYVNTNGLNLYSQGTVTTVDAFSNRWPVFGGFGTWGGSYSGLDRHGNVLYYNSATDIRYYDLANASSGIFASVDTSSGYCYGSRVDDGTLSYMIKTGPNDDSGPIYSLEMPALPHEHKFAEATYSWNEDYTEATASITCTKCGETVDYPASIAVVTDAATCDHAGLVTYTATVVAGGKTFTDEKKVVMDPLAHAFGEGTVILEATPDEPGVMSYVCRNCGYKELEEFAYVPRVCSILTQPEDVSAGVNQTVSFHVEVENAASYQWQYSKTEGKKWINCSASGNTTDTISLKVTSSNSVNIYRCIVTGVEGEQLISESAGVDLLPATVIVMSPRSNAVAIGEYAVFTVEAENAAGYQWQYSKDGAHWYRSSAEGNQTDTLIVKGEQKSQGNRYRCVVTGIDGNTKKSYMAAMIVMTVAPKASKAAVGESVSFSLKAEGIATYQWQYSKDGGQSWYRSSAAGADTDTVTFVASKSNRSMIYRCKLVTPDEATAFTKPVGFAE